MIQLKIASLPDRDNVVVELWKNDLYVAEVSCENGIIEVEFYPFRDKPSVKVEARELASALNDAISELSDLER